MTLILSLEKRESYTIKLQTEDKSKHGHIGQRPLAVGPGPQEVLSARLRLAPSSGWMERRRRRGKRRTQGDGDGFASSFAQHQFCLVSTVPEVPRQNELLNDGHVSNEKKYKSYYALRLGNKSHTQTQLYVDFPVIRTLPPLEFPFGF